MLALCTQISIWVSVSREMGPKEQILKCTLRFALFGHFSKYAHPNGNLSAQRYYSRLLPLDRYPKCLCLGDMKCSLFNG